MLKIDLHVHSLGSDGLNTINEIINFAKEANINVIAITDHGPALLGKNISNDYFYLLGRLIPKFKMKKPKILLGIEVNIIDKQGGIDLPEELLKNLDIVIAGIHPFPDTVFKYYNDRDINTKLMISAIKNVNIDCISHPYDYEYMDLGKVAEVACRYKKLLELNEIHLKKRLEDKNFLKEFKKVVEIVLEKDWYFFCGSDGHYFCEIAQDISIKKAIRMFDIQKKNIINNDLSKIEEFLKIRRFEKGEYKNMRERGSING